LLSNPEALKNLKAPREFHFELGKNEDLSKVKYAFFTGPRSFVVDRDGIKLGSISQFQAGSFTISTSV
jgi:hypothetical protein